MTQEKTSGPCSYPAADVDRMLEDRDRLWCLALISAVPHIGTSRVNAILERFNDLRAREGEVLEGLKNGRYPRL